MRVLVFCPLRPKTSDSHAVSVRIFGRTLQSLLQMRTSGPISFHFERDDYPAIDNVYEHLCAQLNLGRDLALRGGYDALFVAESDVVYPEETLELLSEVDADVAYGLVVSRHNGKWLVAEKIWTEGCKLLVDSQNRERAREVWGKVVPTEGVGMACTLIRREVLERLPFRTEPGAGKGRGFSNDWYFALDCVAAGFRQAHHFGVACGHILTRPAPMILWPDPEASKLTVYEPLPGVRIEPIEPGEEIEVTPMAPIFSLAEAREKGIPTDGKETDRS